MRQILLPLCLLAVMTSCKKEDTDEGQLIPNNQAVSWIKTYGGSNYDFAKAVVQLPNGDYVIAGTTRSVDGDVPGNRVGYDPWITRIDSLGNRLWSNAFGTNADEHTGNFIATPDGGFLLVGHTGFNFDTTSNQGWIIKTDGSGNPLWRKDFTSSNDSKITDVVSTGDGYLAAGYTTTSQGRDGWIIKLDGNGNQQWSKTYGGSKEDQIACIISSGDGGFIASGYSASSDSHISSNKGGMDGWIMKIDAGGGLQWSKTFGGSGKDYFKCIVAGSNGFVAVGNTTSSNGDVPMNHGNFDEWVIKIDFNGNKQWVKTFGGANDEYVTSVVATPDGGYLSIGYTNSTNADVNRNSGDFGGWLIKMDGNGNKVASSTYGDNYDELVDDIITTKDGGYLIAGQAFRPSKTYDAWMVKINGM